MTSRLLPKREPRICLRHVAGDLTDRSHDDDTGAVRDALDHALLRANLHRPRGHERKTDVSAHASQRHKMSGDSSIRTQRWIDIDHPECSSCSRDLLLVRTRASHSSLLRRKPDLRNASYELGRARPLRGKGSAVWAGRLEPLAMVRGFQMEGRSVVRVRYRACCRGLGPDHISRAKARRHARAGNGCL